MRRDAPVSSSRIETPGYRLEPLSREHLSRWDDLTAPHPRRELFHQTPWLEYLAASRNVDIRRWAIRQGSATVGYFCGGMLRMGPFKILGSPLRSWGTNMMGPIVDDNVDHARFLHALDDLAASEALAMVEVEHPALPSDALEAAGFDRIRDWTYLVDLRGGEAAMWRSLASTCRNRIRKAQAAKLVVCDTDDPAVVDEYYDFYLNLMRRKHRRPPFAREVPRLLFEHLKRADQLFAMRVTGGDGRLLAVGLFPHDDAQVYFWSGASREDAHNLCPNDLLHWTVMRMAAARGLTTYNMSGYGRFKRKFGGELVEVSRWHKCYWASARWGRRLYQLWFEQSNRISLGTLSERPFTAARAPLPASSPPNGSVRITTTSQRPSFRLRDILDAPLHDFPIRDEILYQYLPLSPDADMLEIGPGSGFTAFRLARQVRSLTLLDVAPANINQLKAALARCPNVSFVCADVCEPLLAQVVQRTFDTIYAIEVFELLPDPATCLRNLAQILRPGGYLLLQFPNYPPPLSPGMTYFRTKREFDRLMETAEFSSWNVCTLRLRPHARFLYDYLHEKPLQAYRRHRTRVQDRALVYDDSWAFKHGHRLEPVKYALHATWTLLAAAMRLGGPAFEHAGAGEDILHHNLVVLAKR